MSHRQFTLAAICAFLSILATSLLGSAQTLEPNPACPNNSPACRVYMWPPLSQFGAIGYHDGVLYGAQYSFGACNGAPASITPPANTFGNICLYASTTVAPENWTYQGQIVSPELDDVPNAILFGTGSCSNYKYLYFGPHIYRATSDPTDWNFQDLVYPPNGTGVSTGQTPALPLMPLPVPSATPGVYNYISTVLRQGLVMANNSSGNTALFYGNYPSNNCTYSTIDFFQGGECSNHLATCPSPWVSGQTYYATQEVSYNGNNYQCSDLCTNLAPTDSDGNVIVPWVSMDPSVYTAPQWTPSTPYSAGQEVNYFGANFVCTDSCPVGNYPVDNQGNVNAPWLAYQTSGPTVCPHAYVWTSNNCGTTWNNPYAFGEPQYHAQEVHSLAVDSQNNVYAMIHNENADLNPLGVWVAENGSPTFTQLSPYIAPTQADPNPPDNIGIDMVFPWSTGPSVVCDSGYSSNCMFAEKDGAPTGTALLSFNKGGGVNTPLVPAAFFPLPSPSPTPTPGIWNGSGAGILMTSENNIFVGSINDGGDPRQGQWILAPPTYSSPVLVEDMAPPILSAAYNGSVVTITTEAPHDLLPDDLVSIQGVFDSPQDAQNNIPSPCFSTVGGGWVAGLQITGPTTFTYTGADTNVLNGQPSVPLSSNCTPGETDFGGYADKIAVGSLQPSIEVTAPNGIGYIFSGDSQWTKPEFTGYSGFYMTAAPCSQQLQPGGNCSARISITPEGTFSGSVALQAAGLPPGITASFSPAAATSPGFTSTLTFSASSSVQPGAYTIAVSGAAGSTVHSSNVSVTVTPPGSSPGSYSFTGAYWSMNEGSGQYAYDDSGQNHTLALPNSATFVPGVLGTAVHFAGTSGATTGSSFNFSNYNTSNDADNYYGTASDPVSTPIVDTSKSFTVSAWVNLDSLNGYQTFISQSGYNSTQGQDMGAYWMEIGPNPSNNNAPQFAFAVSAASASPYPAYWAASNIPLQAGRWYYLVGVYTAGNPGSNSFYVDGQLQETQGVWTPTWTANGPTTVGCFSAGVASGNPVCQYDSVSGSIDEVRLEQRALQQSEISSDYANVVVPPEAAGSALTGLVDSSGTQHLAYLGANQHLYHVFLNTTGGLFYNDLTALSGAPAPATGSALSSLLDTSKITHYIYLGTNQHAYQILGSGTSYAYEDRTAVTDAPAAAAGSALTSVLDSAGGQHFVYLGTNQHLYDAYWNGSLGYTDLTAAANAPPAAAGSALSSMIDPGGTLHFIYLGSNQHVYQIYGSGSSYSYEDRTYVTNAPVAAAGSALSSFLDSSGGQHFVFLGTNQHVYQAYWIPNVGPGYTDVINASGSQAAAAGSQLTTFVDPPGSPVAGAEHWIYEGTNQHIYQVYLTGTTWGYADTNNSTGAPAAAAGSALSSFADTAYGQHFIYESSNQQLYETYWQWSSPEGYGYSDLGTATPYY